MDRICPLATNQSDCGEECGQRVERVLCVEDSWDCECIERESISVKITGGPLFQNSTHTISHQDYDFISEKNNVEKTTRTFVKITL